MPRSVSTTTDVDSLPYHSLQAEAAKLSIRKNLGAAKLRIAIKRAFDNEGRTDNLPREWLTISAINSTSTSSLSSSQPQNNNPTSINPNSNAQPTLRSKKSNLSNREEKESTKEAISRSKSSTNLNRVQDEKANLGFTRKRRLISPREDDLKQSNEEKKDQVERPAKSARKPFVPLPNQQQKDQASSPTRNDRIEIDNVAESKPGSQIISDRADGIGDASSLSKTIRRTNNNNAPTKTALPLREPQVQIKPSAIEPAEEGLIETEKKASLKQEDDHVVADSTELFDAFEKEVRRMDLSGLVNPSTISDLVNLTRQVLRHSSCPSTSTFSQALQASLIEFDPPLIKNSIINESKPSLCSEENQTPALNKDIPLQKNVYEESSLKTKLIQQLLPSPMNSGNRLSRDEGSSNLILRPPNHLRLISTPARPDLFQPPMIQTPNFSDLSGAVIQPQGECYNQAVVNDQIKGISAEIMVTTKTRPLGSSSSPHSGKNFEENDTMKDENIEQSNEDCRDAHEVEPRSKKKIKISENSSISNDSIEFLNSSPSSSSSQQNGHNIHQSSQQQQHHQPIYDNTTRSVLSPIDEDQEPDSSPHSLDGLERSQMEELEQSKNCKKEGEVEEGVTDRKVFIEPKEDRARRSKTIQKKPSTNKLKLFPDVKSENQSIKNPPSSSELPRSTKTSGSTRLTKSKSSNNLRNNKKLEEAEGEEEEGRAKDLKIIKSPIGKLTLFGTENLYGDSTAEVFGEMGNYGFVQFLKEQ